MRHFRWLLLMVAVFLSTSCSKQGVELKPTMVEPAGVLNELGHMVRPTLVQLERMNQQFRDMEFPVLLVGYTERDRNFLRHLIKAADVMDQLFWQQVSSDGWKIFQALNRGQRQGILSAEEKLVQRLMSVHYGRFDRLKEHQPFLGGDHKPLGASYYPEDFTKTAFEAWVKAHPDQKEQLENEYTVVRYQPGTSRLSTIPYAVQYRDGLKLAARYLNEAAKYADSSSMKAFLEARANAFLSNSYRFSDELWVKVEGSKFEVVIGPYEVYEDRLMNYKAAFQAFITVTDPLLTAKLGRVKGYLDDMEKQIPLGDQYRDYERAKGSPIFAVDLLYSAGDTRAGVQTMAFNLPNDEYVREKVGSKKVLLRNIIEAKFRLLLKPISQVVLVERQQALVSRDSFFWHILLHELSHGMGPGIITVGGKTTTVSKALKNLYAPLEELKAEAMGFWMVDYLVRAGFFPPSMLKETAVASLAGFFRSVRFGAEQAHGASNLMYFNYFKQAGVYQCDSATQKCVVDVDKFLPAVIALTGEVLTIEAKGDYQAAADFKARYGKMPAEAKEMIARLGHIPVDIRPLYVTAELLEQE